MEKTFNITRNELKALINEAFRKLSYLNESVKEGGKAGHMLHPFEVDEYTFGDYKQLVRDLFELNVESFTEKLDGMNIFATVDQNGTVRFARNTSDVKNEFGGMDTNGMIERWGGAEKDETIFKAYNSAYQVFTNIVNKLSNPIEFFNGDGYRIYANCEVIDPIHPNIIPYAFKTLSFHGLTALSTDGKANEVELPDNIFDKKMAILERLFPDNGEAQVTPQVVIKIREDCENAIKEYCSHLDRIEEMAGVGDDTTIIEYRAKLLPDWLRDHGYEILINNPFSEYFLKRWVYGIKDPTLSQYKKIMKQSGVENWMEIYSIAKEFEGKFQKNDPIMKAFDEIMSPVKSFFYFLGNEVINGVQDYANVGREGIVLNSYAEQLKKTQELIATTGDPEFQDEMARCLQKLATLGNKYNAMEGVVFKYRGKTLKLTGSFAALNRAINIKMKISKRYKNQA